MTKLSRSLVVGFAALALGLSMNNMAISKAPSEFKFAIVNIPQIIESSPQITALKIEQQKKISDLAKFVRNAEKDIAKQSTAKNKKTLKDKYNKSLNKKKIAIEKQYDEKLTKIDKEITQSIHDLAKKDGYDVVFAKGAVLYGGDDITEAISKKLK